MFLSNQSRQNMPMNNNQKVPSAAARLAKLPVVSSACARLLVLYTDTKSRHPGLKSVCEVLESSVTALGTAACSRASPVIVKLKPQINDVACKSLDWLEASFPVILSPTEQIVATAKNKMHEIEAGISTAASGTMDCVRHAVTWATSTMNGTTNHLVVETVINAATVGLDTALSLSEALVDKVLPPAEEEEAHLMEGFEAVTFRARYPERLCSLSAKVCRRIYHDVESKIQAVQVMGSLSRPSALVQNLQTTWPDLVWRVQKLPQYLQNQVFSGFFFFIQMYNLNSQPTQKKRSKVRSCLGAAVPLKGVPATSAFQKGRATKTAGFGNGSKIKQYVRR